MGWLDAAPVSTFAIEVAERICAHVALGLTIERAALAEGVSKSTLENWRNRFPELEAALKRAEAAGEVKVASELMTAIGQGITGPEVSARQFWLRTRRHGMWREVQEVRTSQVPLSELADRAESSGD